MSKYPQVNLFDPSHQAQVTEVQIRNGILDELAIRYKKELDKWRSTARYYLYQNKFFGKYGIPWAITICDVRVICEIQPDPGGNANKKLGSFFRDPGFQWTGQFVNTKTPGCHARPIKIWTLSDKKFIEKWGRVPEGAVRQPKGEN